MKTLPQRLWARIEMGNADEWYLLIITLRFPAGGSQLQHGAPWPPGAVPRMMPGLGSCCLTPGNLLCLQCFVWFSDYSSVSNARGELGGCMFVCLFVLGELFGFYFTDFISGI